MVPIADLAIHPQPYVVLSALRAYWQVTDSTLRKWITSGWLPAYRFGRQWRIKTKDAIRFEERSKFKVERQSVTTSS